jgi:hypothetical protein
VDSISGLAVVIVAGAGYRAYRERRWPMAALCGLMAMAGAASLVWSGA